MSQLNLVSCCMTQKRFLLVFICAKIWPRCSEISLALATTAGNDRHHNTHLFRERDSQTVYGRGENFTVRSLIPVSMQAKTADLGVRVGEFPARYPPGNCLKHVPLCCKILIDKQAALAVEPRIAREWFWWLVGYGRNELRGSVISDFAKLGSICELVG